MSVIFGDHDQRTLDQLDRCAKEGVAAVLCADGHLGYSMPIGGVVAYPNHISPSGVGYDIACGNKAVQTDLLADEVDIAGAMDEIVRRISFGIGRVNNEPADHPVLDHIRDADVGFQRGLLDLAAKQLGTVGAGNHYVDLFHDDDGWLWVGVHFGSRGFGHKTATHFLELAKQHGLGGYDGFDAEPTLFSIDSTLGQDYLHAMRLAGEYAYAGRDVVVDTVLDILGAKTLDMIHNHHNFAWSETHDGHDVMVIRKGATPAFPGQRGFVGASMGGPSLIIEGVESDLSREALYSTVHGAGRAMSRSEAGGSRPKKKRAIGCSDRDCGWSAPDDRQINQCPICGKPTTKFTRTVQTKQGRVNWAAVQEQITGQGIELRGGAADEAPEAYKNLAEVISFHVGTVRILKTLTPIGVAMAGPDTVDPYKD